MDASSTNLALANTTHSIISPPIQNTRPKGIFDLEMAHSIVNYLKTNEGALHNRSIIHKKMSDLPYTLAVNWITKEIYVLFKKKGKILGRGGSAIVTIGLSLKTKTQIAVKSGLTRKFSAYERKISEILINKKLDEYFVVSDKYFDYENSKADSKTIAIFEKLDGALSDLLRREPLTLSALIMIAGSIAAKLEILSDLNIVHMDLKPDNILMQGSTPKIADFGFATFKDELGKGQGTPGFWAPEACNSFLKSASVIDYKLAFKPATAKLLDQIFQNALLFKYIEKLPPYAAKPSADIWSFGVVLLFMIDPLCFYQIKEIEPAMLAFNPEYFVEAFLASVRQKIKIRSDSDELSLLENQQFESLFELIRDCLKLNPEERITAKQAVFRLYAIYENLNPKYCFI